MGWLDRVKQTAQRAADEVKEAAGRAADAAGDTAATGKLRLEIRTLNGKLEDAFEVIGAKVYDLHEAGVSFPSEVQALCLEADKIADEIKAKEREAESIRDGN